MIVLAEELRTFQADCSIAERSTLCAAGDDSDMLRPSQFSNPRSENLRFKIVDRPPVPVEEDRAPTSYSCGEPNWSAILARRYHVRVWCTVYVLPSGPQFVGF